MFAALLFWRGWGRLAPAALGFVFCFTPFVNLSHWAEGSPLLAALALVAYSLTKAMIALLLPFVLLVYEETVGPVAGRWWRVSAGLFALTLGAWWYQSWAEYRGIWLPFVSTAALLPFVPSALAMIAAAYWAWHGWRSDKASATNRFSLVLAAFVLMLVLLTTFAATAIVFPDPVDPVRWASLMVVTVFLTMIVPALLAYAALRHKILDIGFAINRTVVYGTVSFVMLAGFGLMEWGAERLLPEEWHKGSELISAGIALAIFLTFHRVRDFVEGWVERLLFHHWHDNEARLKRFVKAAMHYEGAGALAEAFAQELVRFGGGAEAALYLRGGSGFSRAAGALTGAAADHPADDPAFAAMRAENAPVEPAEAGSTLPAALALPMLDHGALAGFVLMGAKAGGGTFRPDESAVLGWAAHQVGLDMQALKARDLKAEMARLKAQNESMQAENSRLTGLIAGALGA